MNVDKNNPVYAQIDGVLFDKAMTTLILYPQGKKGDYTVPDTVVEIDARAFHGCKDLTRITFSQGVMRCYVNMFSGCEQLAGIMVHDDNSIFSSIDGICFDKERRILHQYPQGNDKTKYIVPDGIVRIEGMAFSDCKCLTEIILPESLKYIENYVFSGCEKLTAITLPMGLEYLGKCVFEDCLNLETIMLSRNTKMGHKALEGFSGKLVYRD